MHNKTTDTTVYYRVREDRQEYLGERYFAFNIDSDKVAQVCVTSSHVRGKTNTVGIYLIGRLTFLSNYTAMNYVETISKEVFKEKMQEVVSRFEQLVK